jgi:hypothetical protein
LPRTRTGTNPAQPTDSDSPDAGEAVIVEQQHRQLDAFLNRGRQFPGPSDTETVADHHHDAIRRRHLHAETAAISYPIHE